MGRIQGENHVRSHRLLGTRRRYPSPRQCPPPQVSRPAPGSTGIPIWPTLPHPTGSTRITAGIPAGATGTVSTGTTDMLTRTATLTIGVGERGYNLPSSCRSCRTRDLVPRSYGPRRRLQPCPMAPTLRRATENPVRREQFWDGRRRPPDRNHFGHKAWRARTQSLLRLVRAILQLPGLVIEAR